MTLVLQENLLAYLFLVAVQTCADLHMRQLQQQLHEAGGPPVICILLKAPEGVGLARGGQQP